jgi:hypothetical protein
LMLIPEACLAFQMIASIVDARKKSSKHGLKLWEKPELAEAFADVGATGNRFAMSKEELMAVTKHREGYAAVISQKRTVRKNAHLTKRVEEDDVNLGMDTRR